MSDDPKQPLGPVEDSGEQEPLASSRVPLFVRIATTVVVFAGFAVFAYFTFPTEILSAETPKIVNLTAPEKKQAMTILEHRQDIMVRRQRLDAQYRADVDRLDEEMRQQDIASTELCFQLKKSHQLPPATVYGLDEVNARLVKQ